MNRVGQFFLRNFLTTGIMVGAVAAVIWPVPGLALHKANVLPVVIFCVFMFSGLSLEIGELLRQASDLKALVYGVAAVSVLFPIAAYAIGRLSFLPNEAIVGLMIVASSPPTLASGIILSSLAGGSLSLAILLTVGCSATAVLLMPTALQIVLGLGMKIDLPIGQMMRDLALLVILPTIVGQLLRRPIGPDRIRRRRGLLSLLHSSLVILMIFIAICKSSGVLHGHGLSLVVHVMLIVALLHVVMLYVNHAAARMLKLSEPGARSLTIVASQKTLPLSAYVALAFFPNYPAAAIPCVILHLVQLMIDSALANRWAERSAQPVFSSGG